MIKWYKPLEPAGSAFWSYFDLADEIFPPANARSELTLEDFDEDYVQEARIYAQTHELPWPPDLPTAEEALNDMNRYEADHREDIKR